MASEVNRAVELMAQGMGQRDIERETNLSRPYLRKIAKQIGHQFPRNGIEIVGKLCMCANCGSFFRKPPSKAERAKKQFCENECREAYFKGSLHPSWKTGKSANTFSSWVKNQTAYDSWREAVLERDDHKCIISGRTDNLQAHHIMMKAESFSPEKAFDIDNGITLNFDVHQDMHSLMREGFEFDEAVAKLKEKYSNENRICNKEVSA